MEKYRILIADDDAGFCANVAKALPAQFTATVCADGISALEHAKRETPDAVLANIQLPGLDGIGLLEAVERAGIHTQTFFIAHMLSSYMSRKAQELGVCFIFVSPCTAEEIAYRINDAMSEDARGFIMQSYRQWLANTLTELGIAVKLKGYLYLNDAIPYCAKHPVASISKELYPAVGEQHHTSGTLTEHSIRTAICGAWKQRSEEIWRQYFPPDASGTIPRPSNATFIFILARHLRERFPEIKCENDSETKTE